MTSPRIIKWSYAMTHSVNISQYDSDIIMIHLESILTMWYQMKFIFPLSNFLLIVSDIILGISLKMISTKKIGKIKR